MATPSADPSVAEQPFSDPVDYSENEDEVDQLDSDSEPQDNPVNIDASSTSSQKEGSDNDGVRQPGHSLLPVVRLENIIQAEGVTGNLSMSKEALFILSVATEEFIKRMALAGHNHAATDRRNVVNYRDMAWTTQQYQEFMFLHDTIPSPLSLSEAMALREIKEKEMLEEDPAMSSSISTKSFSAHPYAPKTKAKTRVVNGKDKTNGSASGSRRERRPRDGGGRWSFLNDDGIGDLDGVEVSWAAWSNDPYRSALPQTVQNGMSISTSYAHEGEFLPHIRPIVPVRSREEGAVEPPLPRDYPHQPTFHPQDSTPASWPGQYTGPASGFLQPHGPYGQIPPNPGRTIYSSQHPTEPGGFPSR